MITAELFVTNATVHGALKHTVDKKINVEEFHVYQHLVVIHHVFVCSIIIYLLHQEWVQKKVE
jgi:hypothetical protein